MEHKSRERQVRDELEIGVGGEMKSRSSVDLFKLAFLSHVGKWYVACWSGLKDGVSAGNEHAIYIHSSMLP